MEAWRRQEIEGFLCSITSVAEEFEIFFDTAPITDCSTNDQVRLCVVFSSSCLKGLEGLVSGTESKFLE